MAGARELTRTSFCAQDTTQQSLSSSPSCHLLGFFTIFRPSYDILRRSLLLRFLHYPDNMGPLGTQDLRLQQNHIRAIATSYLNRPYHSIFTYEHLPKPHSFRRPSRSLLPLPSAIGLLLYRQHRIHLIVLARRRIPPTTDL